MTHVIRREQRGEVAAKLDELAASVYPEVGKTLPQARWKSFDSVDRWRIIEALIERISYDHPAAQLIWLTPLWFEPLFPTHTNQLAFLAQHGVRARFSAWIV